MSVKTVVGVILSEFSLFFCFVLFCFFFKGKLGSQASAEEHIG